MLFQPWLGSVSFPCTILLLLKEPDTAVVQMLLVWGWTMGIGPILLQYWYLWMDGIYELWEVVPP